MGCDNAKFKIAVEEEQSVWIQSKLADDYSHDNLMDLGRVTFNNLVESKDWKLGKTPEPKKENEREKIFTLATEILKKFGGSQLSNNGGP